MDFSSFKEVAGASLPASTATAVSVSVEGSSELDSTTETSSDFSGFLVNLVTEGLFLLLFFFILGVASTAALEVA